MNELNSKIDEKNIKINKEMVQLTSFIFKWLYLQLGMMVIAVGLSTYNVALFHLVNHAFVLCRAQVKLGYVL